MAIDYGEKRLGAALSDESKKIAFPQPYISRNQIDDLTELISRNDVDIILIGLPRGLAGQETKTTKKVRTFVDWLKSKTKAEIKFVDERYSTRHAAQKLREQEIKAKQSKNLIDSMSAQLLLETYLKKFRNSTPSSSPP
ncbi:MAG: Holliday junction resolvase RuvX [Candidatus Doudnabacteria bacterium]|nr:Holliday junction resolvase RuvX [Candidatus Doudnabacteria bacterium]